MFLLQVIFLLLVRERVAEAARRVAEAHRRLRGGTGVPLVVRQWVLRAGGLIARERALAEAGRDTEAEDAPTRKLYLDIHRGPPPPSGSWTWPHDGS